MTRSDSVGSASNNLRQNNFIGFNNAIEDAAEDFDVVDNFDFADENFNEPPQELGLNEPSSKASRQTGKTFNADKAADHLRSHARKKSHKKCAYYVRLALAAGGLKITPPPSHRAKDYGSSLEKAGMQAIANFHQSEDGTNDFPVGYTPKKGDVIIIQPCPGHPIGHMVMYDGNRWIAETPQQDFWGAKGYRDYKPDYAVYRMPDATTNSSEIASLSQSPPAKPADQLGSDAMIINDPATVTIKASDELLTTTDVDPVLTLSQRYSIPLVSEKKTQTAELSAPK